MRAMQLSTPRAGYHTADAKLMLLSALFRRRGDWAEGAGLPRLAAGPAFGLVMRNT